MIILITGITSGFGKAMAERLSRDGHKVYGTHRHAQEQIPGVTYIKADATDVGQVKNAVDTVMAGEGRIDVFINNAGMGIAGSLELATQEEIRVQMDTNFMGCVNLCQKVLPYMRKQGYGKIINLSSIGGVMGLPYQGFYSASKFAIEGFSEALSAEVKRWGISVSLVEPGDFATNFTASRKNSEITMKDPEYGPVFKKSLSLIEKEENGGLKPEVLAKRIEGIVEAKRPRLRYVVANLEQKLSVLLKRVLPGNMFVNILRGYYKS